MKWSPDEIADNEFLPPGRYYVRVVDAWEESGNEGDVGISIELVALSPPGAAGQKVRDRLWLAGDHAKRLKIAARALGMRDHGTNVEISTFDFLGRECWVEVAMGKPFVNRKGKEVSYSQVTYAGYEAGAKPADCRETTAAKPVTPAPPDETVPDSAPF